MAQSVMLPTLADIRSLLTGARALGGALGTTLELTILTLRGTAEVLEMDLAYINWSEGWVPISGRNGKPRRIALTAEALAAISRVAGSAGGRGQAVTAGRGKPLGHRDVRLDRLQQKVLPLCPKPISVEWNIHSIRAAAGEILAQDGIGGEELSAALRSPSPRDTTDRHDPNLPVRRARVALGHWSQLLAQKSA